MPKEPVISIFTSFENNYQVASGIKKPQKEHIKEYVRKIEFFKSDLRKFGAKDGVCK